MHCVSVTYRVSGLPDEELREAFAAAVPAIRAVPGLGLKLWLADPDERAFGGVYVFESARAADDYLDSPFFIEAVRDNPYFADVEVHRHTLLEEPTRATSRWVSLPAPTSIAIAAPAEEERR